MQSSQSSVLEGLGSASLPIDQLQLKAAAIPCLSPPQQTSALAIPQFWDTTHPPPTGAIGMQGSSQTPWLSSGSQSVPVSSVQPKAPSQEPNGSELTLKRGRSEDEFGAPVNSKPSKRTATESKSSKEGVMVNGGIGTEVACSKHEEASKQAPAGRCGNAGGETGSPDTSSHSSSPESASVKEATEPAQG